MKGEDKDKLVEKIITCLQRGYLDFTQEHEVDSYIDYFAVPKGENDIRMVFNWSSCGLTVPFLPPIFGSLAQTL